MSSQEWPLTREQRRVDRRKETENVRQHEIQQQRQAQVEDEAAWKIREVEILTTAIFEEQRLTILKEAAYELGMQENKAANAVQILEQQLHQHYMEFSSRSFDFENSQGSQLCPLPNY